MSKSVWDKIVQQMINDDLEEDDLYDLYEQVSSTAINSLGYSEDDTVLTVEFVSGSRYEYYGVSKQTAKYFIDYAASKGKYLNKRIKPVYMYSRIG